MAKDSILTGAVNSSSFKNKGTEATLAADKNGLQPVPSLQKRTKSPNAQNEVLRVTYKQLTKPSTK